jgi:hypothetical protein
MSETHTSPVVPVHWWPDEFGQPYPPAVMQSMICPAFGGEITRLTDADAMGRVGLAAEYSHSPIANCDGTLVRFVETGTGEQMVFEVATGNHVRSLIGSTSSSDYWWDVDDPNLIYAMKRGGGGIYPAVMRQEIDTGHAFEHIELRQYPSAKASGESGLSLDGDLLALTSSPAAMSFVVSLSQKRVVSELDHSLIGNMFDASLSECGKYYKVANILPSGLWNWEIYNVNATASGPPGVATHRFSLPGSGHNDACVGPDGASYIIGAESQLANYITSWNLDTGEVKTLYQAPGWIPTGGGPDGHFSANSTYRDGWVYFSVNIGSNFVHDPADHWEPYRCEIIRFPYDGSGPIERLCHHRSQITPTNGYWGFAKVNSQRLPMPNGDEFVFFSSTFLKQESIPGTPALYSDGYMLRIPAGASPMADIDNYKAGLTNAGITFTEEDEMQPAVPTGNTLVTMTDDDGDTIVAKFDANGAQIDLDANPT